jgi:hypothetical protein
MAVTQPCRDRLQAQYLLQSGELLFREIAPPAQERVKMVLRNG